MSKYKNLSREELEGACEFYENLSNKRLRDINEFTTRVTLNTYEKMIFDNEKELKKHIKKDFKLHKDCKKIELIKKKGLDDEYCFFTEELCCSIYVMRGNSGRLIVVETNGMED